MTTNVVTATAPPGSEPILANYQLRLSSYEGPLDVLLRLIERSQLDIEDVSLVAVTSQFLAFVATLDTAPSFVIADFAAVGGRLTVLKSRSLLPRPVVDAEEPEQSDLTHQLREYRRIKDLAKNLGAAHARGLSAFGPAAGGAVVRPLAGKPSRLGPHDPSSLVRSIRRRLTIIPRQPEVVRQRRVISLRDLVARVAEHVADSSDARFGQIVSGFHTRTDVATAFLAVLVLIRRQSIDASQGDLYGEIALRPGLGAMLTDPSADDDAFVN